MYGIMATTFVCVCVGGGGGGGGESLNENSNKREVFRLFIFHIVSPILQQTGMTFIKKKCGRYKVRKEPSPAKRCEKSGKDAKRAMFYGRKADSAISCI